jgi:hypothetical protein
MNGTVAYHTNKIYCSAKSAKPTDQDDYYVDGCYLKLKDLFYGNYNYVLILIVSFTVTHFLALISVLILINNRFKLLKKSRHPPYVNIEAEYEDEYTNQNILQL